MPILGFGPDQQRNALVRAWMEAKGRKRKLDRCRDKLMLVNLMKAVAHQTRTDPRALVTTRCSLRLIAH